MVSGCTQFSRKKLCRVTGHPEIEVKRAARRVSLQSVQARFLKDWPEPRRLCQAKALAAGATLALATPSRLRRLVEAYTNDDSKQLLCAPYVSKSQHSELQFGVHDWLCLNLTMLIEDSTIDNSDNNSHFDNHHLDSS